MTKTEIARQYALENGYEVVDMSLVPNYSHRTVYAVFEFNADDPNAVRTLSKLYTKEEDAERWASILWDEAAFAHASGKEPIRYKYIVEPWELHEQ